MSIKCYDIGTNPFPPEGQFEVIESNSLQCTSLAKGSNKFYQMELHKGDDGQWRIFTANGRTGVYSKPRERITSDEAEARKEYAKLLKKKLTRKNEPYTNVGVVSTTMGTGAGNKRILTDDFKQDNVTSSDSNTKVKALPPIPASIRVLIGRLYNEAGESCRSQLHGSLKTSEKNPLGTLSLTQIDEGKAILTSINVALSANPDLIDTVEDEVVDLTNAFYSAIPHNIPWRPRSESARERWMRDIALNNTTILDEKFDLLEILADVEGMIGGFATTDEHARLQEANCEFEEVDAKTSKSIKDYMTDSQSKHHNWKLIPKRVWTIKSKAQSSHRPTMDKIGNIKALWHGSRSGNILGICKKGLLMRPPGAYITASMFGIGLYFADQSSKSSQYSTARFNNNGDYHHGDTAFMFVADVALGRVKRMESSDSSLVNAGRGHDSVMGVKGNTGAWGGSLLHNEFIIYDTKQDQLTYLVEFGQKY